MNNLKNHVQLIGRLGNDVEVMETGNGNKYARLRIATNEHYYDKKGEKVENTTWHNCVAWGKNAENLGQYAEKGKQLVVQGKLTNRNYEDKNGETKYVTEIQVNEFLMVN